MPPRTSASRSASAISILRRRRIPCRCSKSYAKIGGSNINRPYDEGDPRNTIGVVKQVSPSKDGGVLVAFKTVSWQEPTLDCKSTGRIASWRIANDRLTPEYHYSCKQIGTHTVSRTPPTTFVAQPFAKWIKAGNVAELVVDTHTDPQSGFPYVVYADQSKKKTIAYWGVQM